MTPSRTLETLCEQEAQFLTEYLALGGDPEKHAPVAVIRAGYTKSQTEAVVIARMLLINTRITAALKNEIGKRFAAAAGVGLKTVLDLCNSATSEQVRLSAAKELLDRGVGPIISRNAHVHASVTIEDLLARLDAGDAAPAEQTTVDAQFVEITDARTGAARDAASEDAGEPTTIDHEPAHALERASLSPRRTKWVRRTPQPSTTDGEAE
jgi:hypothetical protein